jgi:hypothetical protein
MDVSCRDTWEAIMKGPVAAVFSLCGTLAASDAALAKAEIARIEIRGAHLEAPLEIADPRIVREFSIWIGPGVRINGEPAHLDPANTRGMFIDWPKGAASTHPKGLKRYDVTFHLGVEPGRGVQSERWARYNVVYEFDPATGTGFFYLPAAADGRDALNPAIYHGVEGNWFHSTRAWELLVRPLIEANSCDSHAANASPKRPRRPLVSFI